MEHRGERPLGMYGPQLTLVTRTHASQSLELLAVLKPQYMHKGFEGTEPSFFG